jgi:hypothetical protein
MEKIRDLLKGNFWILDLARVRLSPNEIDFLSNFYDVIFDQIVDDMTGQERPFLILTKKPKFVSNPYVN